MALLIRPYLDSDFEAVAEIWFSSWISSGVDAPDPALRAELRERLPREIASGWSIHVGTIGSKIVGFLALTQDQLTQLFVAPDMQGRGVGKRLLDFAKARRPRGFYLTTPTASRACRFYEREGLSRGETGVHPKRGHPIVRYNWRP